MAEQTRPEGQLASTKGAPASGRAMLPCSTCGTENSATSEQCGGCGKILLPAKVCRQCGATSHPRKEGRRLLCGACGALLEVVDEPRGTGTETTQLAARGVGAAMRVAAGMGLGFSILMASILAMVSDGPMGYGLAVLSGALGVSFAVRLMRSARRREQSADTQSTLAQVRRQGGRVTPTSFAQATGISVEVAEARLTALAEAMQLQMDVDEEGELLFSVSDLPEVETGPTVRLRAPRVEDPLDEAFAALEEEEKKRGSTPRD